MKAALLTGGFFCLLVFVDQEMKIKLRQGRSDAAIDV
jgi:hypothetical protein